MAGVTIRNARVVNNPSSFTDPFVFEITYEALQDLDEDLEWKVTYLSSPSDSSLDQELENVLVGPISSGIYKFTLEAEAPDGAKVPMDDLIGNTGIVLSCSFHGQEFIRVGFFVHVDYPEDDEMRDNPPEQPSYEKLVRNVANDDPRVTTKPLDMADLSKTAENNPLPSSSESHPIKDLNDVGMRDEQVPSTEIPQLPKTML